MKLAHKYSLVGSKVESLVRAEEDLNADNIAKLTAQLNAATTQLQDRKRLFSREKDALKVGLDKSASNGLPIRTSAALCRNASRNWKSN